MKYSTRRAVLSDAQKIADLYRLVAAKSEGLARRPEEISDALIAEIIEKCSNYGLIIILEDIKTKEIDGVIHAEGNEIQDLRHIMSHLTFLIRPEFQGRGLGKSLFKKFLEIIISDFPHILRVELRARSSNKAALGLYQSLGFKAEGLFRSRIRGRTGILEDGIPMVWFNSRTPAIAACELSL